MRMPSREEQLTAEDYVLRRVLERPNTDIKKAVICVVIYLLSSLTIAFSTLFLFSRLGIFDYFPAFARNLREYHHTWFVVLYILLIYFITGLCCLRMAAIGCIRLYQHYAPENVRRRCLFMPTCSEYAILVIKKYGVIIGMIKTYNRLVKRCRGDVFSIDYP